ncbi:MAG: hypothetical protein WC595_00585 [Candidatus Nanoarchaeia archaeon]
MTDKPKLTLVDAEGVSIEISGNLPEGTVLSNPRRAEQYTVQEKIGEGGEGQTYKAQDSFGRGKVVKVVRASRSQTVGEVVDKLSKELLQVNAALRTNYETFGLNGLDFAVVADFVPGRNLEQEVDGRNRVFQESETADCVKQVLGRYLVPLHERGLVHRDVKPQNIIFNPSLTEYVLIDFGLLRETGTATLTLSARGTPGYSSFKLDHNPADDVSALAKTAAFLLTGKHPALLAHEEYEKIENKKVIENLNVSSDLKNVLGRMVGLENKPITAQEAYQLIVSLEEGNALVQSSAKWSAEKRIAHFEEAPRELHERIVRLRADFMRQYEGAHAARHPLSPEFKEELGKVLRVLGYKKGEGYSVKVRENEHVFIQDDFVRLRREDAGLVERLNLIGGKFETKAPGRYFQYVVGEDAVECDVLSAWTITDKAGFKNATYIAGSVILGGLLVGGWGVPLGLAGSAVSVYLESRKKDNQGRGGLSRVTDYAGAAWSKLLSKWISDIPPPLELSSGRSMDYDALNAALKPAKFFTYTLPADSTKSEGNY